MTKVKLGVENLNFKNFLDDFFGHTESWINFLKVWEAEKGQGADAKQGMEDVWHVARSIWESTGVGVFTCYDEFFELLAADPMRSAENC